MTKQTLNPLATVRANAPCVCVSKRRPSSQSVLGEWPLFSKSQSFSANLGHQFGEHGSKGSQKGLQLESPAKSDFYKPVDLVGSQFVKRKARVCVAVKTFFDYFSIRVRRDGCFVAPTAAGARRSKALPRRGDRSKQVN